jgi:hypothetical protein
MAVIAIQNGTGGLADVTTAAATGGGDTIAQGTRAAGWDQSVVLVVRNADATLTNVTVNGVVYACPATTGLSLIPVGGIYFGSPVAVTYSKVTSLTVGAVRLAPAP